MRSDVVMLWYTADGMDEAILYALEASNLVGWEVEVQRVAVVQFRMDKRSGHICVQI